MSTGYYNKGKDGKYNTLNLTSYKGRSVDSSKHSGTSVRHGLQSLGKVASTRRVPPPASIPSLKSENLGNDPNVNLVPKDGSGWASKSETPPQQQSQQPASQAPQESQPRQASATHSQPSMYNQPTTQSVPTSRSQISSSTSSSGTTQQTWGSSRYSQAGNRVPAPAGGARAHGTTPFSEEFPTLEDTQKEQQSTQNNDKSKEQPYGPGPSLRPQNVAMWKEGGGRMPPSKESHSPSDESKLSVNDPQNASHVNQAMSAFDMPQSSDGGQTMPQRTMPPYPGMGQNVLPGHSHQYRPNMMPPFMYNNRFQHPGIAGPGMRYPANIHPRLMYSPAYANEMRFRGMVGQGPPSQLNEAVGMPSIISPSDLKEFDKLEKDDEGGWAGMHGEVDYGEKLVFSDEEENGTGKKSSKKSDSLPNASSADTVDRKPKDASNMPRQGWNMQPQPYHMDSQAMAQWRQQPYYMFPGAVQMDPRSKPQGQYDKRMSPQGQPYPMVQMGSHPIYGHMHHPAGRHFSGHVPEPPMERVSPRGDDDNWRKNEKEEAMERARKRREDEERRMEMQRRSGSDDPSYLPVDAGRDSRSHPRFNSEEEMKNRPRQDYPSSQESRVPYMKRRTESESSDERRNTRDRVPGDGYGGGYRPQPHPSAGSQPTGGRNLPPRLANQKHKQDNWQRTTSPGLHIGYDPHWVGGQQPQQKQNELPRTSARPSIMKREHPDNGGHDIRKLSESSSHSHVTPSGETIPSEERRMYSGREFFRRADDKRNAESASPSTTSSEREPRLWEAGSSKRSSIKRQSSRDSPVSVGSTSDAHHAPQKMLPSGGDSGGKPVTRWGSNQSNKSVEKDEGKQSTAVRPRRSLSEKMKLRDFRVECDSDEEANYKNKKTDGVYKSGKNSGQHYASKGEGAAEPRTWKNDAKATRPVATVLPSTSTTTATVSKATQQKFVVTANITRDVVQQSSDNEELKEPPLSISPHEEPLSEVSRSKPAWKQDSRNQTSAIARDETKSTFASRDIRYHNPSWSHKERQEKGGQSYHDRSDKPERRYSNRDGQNNDRPQRDRHINKRGSRDENRGRRDDYHGTRDDVKASREDRRGPRDDNRSYRGFRSEETRHRHPQDKYRRNNEDRFDNHKDSRDHKRDHDDNQDRKTAIPPAKKNETKQPTTSKPAQEKPVATTAITSTVLSMSKPTMASAPVTNIWEERKKQMQKEVEKNTFTPKEEDKKRTLKETAPPPKVEDDFSTQIPDEKLASSKKARDDSTVLAKPRPGESRPRRTESFPDKRPLESKSFRDGNTPRGSLHSQNRDRKFTREYSYENERSERGSRGSGPRGRSRGSNYRGGRGRGQSAATERSSGRGSAPPKGRGTKRGTYRPTARYYEPPQRSGASREKAYPPRRYDDDYEFYSMSEGSSGSDDEQVSVPRRRKVGEASDADDYSSDGSYSDDEAYPPKSVIKRSDSSGQDSRPKQPSLRRNLPRSSHATSHSQGTFTARGEPSRRGRGRGGAASGAPRGRGRGSNYPKGGSSSVPPTGRGRRVEDLREQPPRAKNGERPSQGGAESRRFVNSQSADHRRKRKPDRPPRFKNTPKAPSRDGNSDLKPFVNGVSRQRYEATSPGGDGVHSSDFGNDEWETASDTSIDFKKASSKVPTDETKRNEPKRSFANQRPPASGRGRGRGADRVHQDKGSTPKTDNQVFTVHSVNYTNPGAIEGALRDASYNQEEKTRRFEEGQKAKHEELFRMYELNNYAGVVNVDDLPDVSQMKYEPDLGLTDDVLSAVLNSTAQAGGIDDDGFTPVLSKRAQKKKHDEIRKKDKEERMNEAVRKAKLDQQRQNRQKFFNKTSGAVVASGTSGSVKQPVPPSGPGSNDIWSTIDTWIPGKAKQQTETCADASVSQHDSGVESSVPSSQRSSPGTEAKLSFSHFGSVITSTSVITSVCADQVPPMTTVVQSSGGLSTLMTTQATSTLPKSDLVAVLSEASSASQSPNRSGGNPMGPIGNERIKITKRSESVENITSLFPTMNDKNVISFIADDTDDKDIRTSTFSPFGEPPVPSGPEIRGDLTPRQGFTGFQQKDFTGDRSSTDLSLSNSNFPLTFSKQTSMSASLTGDLPLTIGSNSPSRIDRQIERSSFRHNVAPITKAVLQPGLLDTIPPDIALANQPMSGLAKAGVKSDSESPEDMTLTPQAPSNQNVNHSNRPLEGSIPAPIPMPQKHSAGSTQGPDGDSKTGVRQALDVNSSTNGAGDMGLLTPTSPSIDFNLKMESARKAWENMPESSGASSQQGTNANESYAFHQSSAAGTEHKSVEQTPHISSVTLSVTKSSEWKPRQPAGTNTPSSDVDESWRNAATQQPSSSNQLQPASQAQDFSKNTSETPTNEPAMTLHAGFSSNQPGSTVMTQPHHQPQLVAPSYNSSSAMMFVDPSGYSQAHRLTAVQGTPSNMYQTISSSSLASNLHNMQQAYTTLPPDFNQSLYSSQAPGYSNLTQHPTHAAPYGTQHREYAPPVVLTSTAMGGPSAVKPSTQNTIALKPGQQQMQAAIRGGGMPASYAGASAMQGLSQQTNLGSAPLAVPRPHGGAASPAQPITYIPLMDQNRVVAASQPNQHAGLGQVISTPQRPQSTSFFSQMNQPGSSYYAQQPVSQVHRQQPYQPTIAAAQTASYPQGGVYQTIKPMSPTPPSHVGVDHGSIWTLGNIQQSPSYAPIAPPTQRVRNDGDFSSQGMQYYPQAQKGVYPAAVSGSKGAPHAGQGSGGYGTIKPNVPASSSYVAMKSGSQGMYAAARVSTPANEDSSASGSHQMAKYSMTNTTSSGNPPFIGQPTGGDWNKAHVSNSQQNKANAVQGILSRPFSSTDPAFQQSPPHASMSYFNQKPQDMSMGPRYPQQNAPPAQQFNPNPSGWGQKPVTPLGGQGLMGSQPSSFMGKGPRPPMPPSSMMDHRMSIPQNFQQSNMSQQQSVSVRTSVPFQPKGPTSSAVRMASPTNVQRFTPPADAKQSLVGKSNKSSQPSYGKAPPVPTLVRGSGSNLAGRKPNFMPQEVVKSNQANERANLLQSLSAFFPDKTSDGGEASESKDWSSQVASSAPLPKRKPGLRHPGIDRRKSNKDSKGDSIGAAKNLKRLQKHSKKEEPPPSVDAESLVRPVKQMTLAETKPKKGEVAKIHLS